MTSRHSRFAIALCTVLLLSALARVWNMNEQSIWYDEWNGLGGMYQPTFGAAQQAQPLNDDMVPLYFALQYYWAQATGHDLTLVRILPLVFGVGSVAILLLLGTRLHSLAAGFLAAVFMAISPYCIQFSHELRPYSLMLFLGLTSMYAVTRLLADNRLRWWLLALAMNVLLMWTHLFGLWLIVTEGLILLFLRPSHVWKLTAWTVAHVVFFIPIILHMMTWEQMGEPPLESSPVFLVISIFFMDASHLLLMPRAGLWGRPPEYAQIEPAFVPFLDRLIIPLTVILGLAIAFTLTIFIRQFCVDSKTPREQVRPVNETRWLLLLWFLAPATMLYGFSVLVIPAFQVRYLLYSLPALYLIVAITVIMSRRSVLRHGVLTLFLIPLALLGLLAANIPLRPDHQGASQLIRAQYQDGDKLVLHPFNSVAAFQQTLGRDDIPSFQSDRLGEAILELDRVVEGGTQGWFVLMPWWHTAAARRVDILEYYLQQRGIEFERSVYAGWWDIYVYRCWKGERFRPIGEQASRAAVVLDDKEPSRQCTIGWVLAKAAQDATSYAEACQRYQGLLDSLPESDEASEEMLELAGWCNDLFDSPLRNDFRATVQEGIASCEAKLTAGRAARAPTVYRFDDHADDGIAVGEAMPHRSRATKRVLWPSDRPWATGEAESVASVENGVLRMVTKGRDGLTTPDGFDVFGPAVDSILIDAEVDGVDEIYLSWKPADTFWDWCDEDGNLLIPIRVEQGKRSTFIVPVAEMRGWQHRRIEGIRIVTKKAADIRLHEFRLNLQQSLFEGASHGAQPFRIGNETRPCLHMWTPGQLEFEVPIPHSAVFSAGLAAVESDSPVTFRVEVSHEGRTHSETWQADGPGAWNDISMDLSAYAGQTIRMRLTADGDDGQVALWGNPQVVSMEPPVDQRPSFLVYVVDSLRADHLNTYGYERGTGPRIEQLARQGVVLERFFASETCTKPSMTTFHTGVDASEHGLTCTTSLDAGGLTQLPELLRRSGYETIAITENLYTPPESDGRPVYSYLYDLDEDTAASSGATFTLIQQALERVRQRPFFLYVHTMECHIRIDQAMNMTYGAPPPFGGTYTGGPDPQIDGYDDSIRFADANFGRALDALGFADLGHRTLVLFTGDHGEGFGVHEGRIVHGYEPYNELIRVPLVIRLPGRIPEGVRISGNAQFVDLAPTLLDYADLPPCEQFSGTSLRRLLDGAATSLDERPIPGYTGELLGPDAPRSLILGSWKLLGTPDRLALFDLLNDPDETNDVAGIEKDRYDELRPLFDAQTAEIRLREGQRLPAEGLPTLVRPETDERLRALGYLGDDRTPQQPAESSAGN